MSTLEQQEMNIPAEQPGANSTFEEDIISQQAGPQLVAEAQEPVYDTPDGKPPPPPPALPVLSVSFTQLVPLYFNT